MQPRYRPGVTSDPWTVKGLAIQANIADRTRRIAPEVNGRQQSTLDRFAKPISFYRKFFPSYANRPLALLKN